MDRNLSVQQSIFADNGGADLLPTEVGVEDIHRRLRQSRTGAALLDDHRHGDLGIVVGGEAHKGTVVGIGDTGLRRAGLGTGGHHTLTKTASGKMIYPKTMGQKDYYFALKNNDVVFGVGPAGTGKTYLAVVFAVDALKNNIVKKIVLTRPAVEAGENLGFLPGDLKEKVDPYLRPLYDALHDMLGVEQTERLIEKGVIEIAPLAYMRGRTLEDAYVILDEAQNTTDNQMKMFLTRLGFNSKMIITGDITQIDLPRGVESGLIKALKILKGVKGISFIHLTAMDVVRHPVVQRIIERYEGKDE